MYLAQSFRIHSSFHTTPGLGEYQEGHAIEER